MSTHSASIQRRTATLTRRTWTVPEIIAGALLASLAAMNVYRAWAQSITIDEAFTYLSFVEWPFRLILTTYSPNHHVLYNLLAKVSVAAFGLSDFTLRIPSLLGGFAYFAIALTICRRLFGRGWMMLLGVALLTLHPLILDLCSIARGYSIALACYLIALLCLKSGKRVWIAGAALGLALAANLTFAPAVIALDIVFAITLAGQTSGRLSAIARLLGPEIAVAALVNAGPLSHAHLRDFAGGYGSIFESLKNFAVSAVWHQWSNHHVWKISFEFFDWIYPACRIAVLLALAILLFVVIRRVDDSWIFFCGATLLVTVVILILLHRLAGLPYPMARMAIYAWPLMVFPGLLLIRRGLSGGLLSRGVAGLFLAFCMLLVLQFALQFNVNHYAGFVFDAGTKRVVNFIRQRTSGVDREYRVTASGPLLPSLNFYRQAYSLRWPEVTRRSPDTDGASDYVVFVQFELADIPANLRTVYVDPVSQATVTVPR